MNGARARLARAQLLAEVEEPRPQHDRCHLELRRLPVVGVLCGVALPHHPQHAAHVPRAHRAGPDVAADERPAGRERHRRPRLAALLPRPRQHSQAHGLLRHVDTATMEQLALRELLLSRALEAPPVVPAALVVARGFGPLLNAAGPLLDATKRGSVQHDLGHLLRATAGLLLGAGLPASSPLQKTHSMAMHVGVGGMAHFILRITTTKYLSQNGYGTQQHNTTTTAGTQPPFP